MLAGLDAPWPWCSTLRLAMMVNGVDLSGSPDGLASATHGEAELADTLAAVRKSIRMLKQEGEI